ncbi:NrsF family protein [Haliangium sp.]|uniref:NrsF family protein n=1 Tax=Haliangium sp. TaxID=2663208 RepID=UPI003D130371
MTSAPRIDLGDDRLDHALGALGSDLPVPPPLGDELEQSLAELAPITPRRPKRQYTVVAALSLLYAGFLLLMTDLRPDLSGLPNTWLIVYAAVWLVSFLGITWLVLVPGPDKVMPNWRYAGIGAAIAIVGFVLGGMLFPHDPGQPADAPLFGKVVFAHGCLVWGTITALVPIALASLLLRGSVPVGSRWVGAGIGAAGGSLGGLFLHLHCPVADAFHLGVIHGGVVLVSAVLGAVVLPQARRA